MKNYAFIFICLIFSSCGPEQDTSNEITSDSTLTAVADTGVRAPVKRPASVDDIKQLYADLNDKLESRQLDSVSIKYDCNGERTGTVTYFSENGKLRVIRHVYSEYSHF